MPNVTKKDLTELRQKATSYDEIMSRMEELEGAKQHVKETNAEHQGSCAEKKKAEKNLYSFIEHLFTGGDMFDEADAKKEAEEADAND